MLQKPLLGSLIFILIAPNLFAASHPSQKQFNQLFSHSSKPPKGFETLAQPQKILIDIYYLDHLIGVSEVSVSPNQIKFIRPDLLLTQIDNLSDPKGIELILQKPLKSNSHLVCNQEQRQNCNVLQPEIVDVIYDPILFRLYLFINPKYLKTQHYEKEWIESSSAGWSYLNDMLLVGSRGKTPPLTHVQQQIDTNNLYNLTSTNVVAYHNTRLNASASYANTAGLGTVDQHNQGQLNALNLAHTHHQYELTAGLIEIPSTIFFSSHALLGAEVKTTLNTLKARQFLLSAPLTVFLPTASTVNVLQGGRLVYSAKLPAGNQLIDTSNFPQGSYPVTISITDAQGSTNTITEMVTNSSLLPPKEMPQYSFSLGYLMGIRQLNSNVYDNLLPIPVYQGEVNYLLYRNFGVMMSVLGSNKAAFFNPGVTFLIPQLIVQPGLLFSTNQHYGYTFTLNWQRNQWSANFNINQVLHSGNRPQENYCLGALPNTCALNLLNQGLFSSSASLNYGFSAGSFGIFASQNNGYDNVRSYTYGANLLTALHQSAAGSWQLNLNASRRQNEISVFAIISYTFNDATKTANVGMGYGHFKNTYNDNPRNVSGSGLTTQGNVVWHKTDDLNHGYTVGLQGNTSPINNTASLIYDVLQQKYHANTYVTDYNINQQSNYLQYGGTFNSRYAWSQNKMALGSGNGALDHNSGIIVHVTTKNSRAAFDVYADDRVVAHVRGNHNAFIRLDAYKTWHIRIVDTSSELYDYDNNEHLVTLYPGNVQTLNWEAMSMYSLSGTVVNAEQLPLANATVTGGLGFTITDEDGYLQININDQMKRLKVHTTNGDCTINLPTFERKNKNFVYINKLKCNT